MYPWSRSLLSKSYMQKTEHTFQATRPAFKSAANSMKNCPKNAITRLTSVFRPSLQRTTILSFPLNTILTDLNHKISLPDVSYPKPAVRSPMPQDTSWLFLPPHGTRYTEPDGRIRWKCLQCKYLEPQPPAIPLTPGVGRGKIPKTYVLTNISSMAEHLHGV